MTFDSGWSVLVLTAAFTVEGVASAQTLPPTKYALRVVPVQESAKQDSFRFYVAIRNRDKREVLHPLAKDHLQALTTGVGSGRADCKERPSPKDPKRQRDVRPDDCWGAAFIESIADAYFIYEDEELCPRHGEVIGVPPGSEVFLADKVSIGPLSDGTFLLDFNFELPMFGAEDCGPMHYESGSAQLRVVVKDGMIKVAKRRGGE
jgi:hypothetical protein